MSLVFAACVASLVSLKETPFKYSLSFGNKKSQMGQGLGYEVDVAAIPTKILSKHLLRSEKNALGRCRDGKEFHDGVFLDTFQLILPSIFLKLLRNSTCNSSFTF